MPSYEVIDCLRRDFPIGSLVKLVCMDDPAAPPIGTVGKVFFVDDTGTIHVHWSNGSDLGVLYGIDRVVKVSS